MSRIGKQPITLPKGVEVTVGAGTITVKGPKGTLTKPFHPDMILKTEDGGRTWARQLDGVQLADALLAAAGSDERARRDAERMAQEGPDKPFFDIDASDANHAVVVGAYNLAFETTDGGKSWKALSPTTA